VRVNCAADGFARCVVEALRGVCPLVSLKTFIWSSVRTVQYKQSPTLLPADTPIRSRNLSHSSTEAATDGRVNCNSVPLRVG
jgi:hypothetical protein